MQSNSFSNANKVFQFREIIVNYIYLITMEDTSKMFDQLVDDKEIQQMESEKYFEEQNKKFEDLQIKLQSLREENKRQMDIIINNLDQMMANKCIIDKTLKDQPLNEDKIVNDKNMSVVDLLTKLTESSTDFDNLETNSADLNVEAHCESRTIKQDTVEKKTCSKTDVQEENVKKSTKIKKETLNASTKSSENSCTKAEDIGKVEDSTINDK